MTSTRATAAGVLERFPGDWQLIIRLCGKDEAFRELCEHYAECQAMLGRLRTSGNAKQALVREYEDLVGELELEVRKTLDAVT